MSCNRASTTAIKNLKLQSKVLARKLNIKLTCAQYLLASYVYCEKSYSNIKKRIERDDYSDMTYLSLVSPKADDEILNLYRHDVLSILTRMQTCPALTGSEYTLKELLVVIFGVDEGDS